MALLKHSECVYEINNTFATKNPIGKVYINEDGESTSITIDVGGVGGHIGGELLETLRPQHSQSPRQ